MNGQSNNATNGTSGEQLRRSKFELGVSLALHTWPALSLSVQNQWGGPDSTSKRDWFAGAMAELFPTDGTTTSTSPAVDVMDVEDRLMQIMEDEFEVVPDDDSVSPVADLIMGIWAETQRGEFGRVDRLFERWKVQGERRVEVREGERVDQDVKSEDEDSVDGEEDDDDEDEEMGDAPPLVRMEKVAPQMDEEGFETVVKKKRR
ncbi:hypothetical protein EJ08DRAFT_646682 [Tothia fuscella]|uniref:Pre-rRNA-processing protein TSR2 n=1 Tax=Tothia fuscella TaxID=1048955 RepID=A0A9P4NYT6_9PEZI|nr:hypothetical protein EJ08DRAFT_646682 [Tothia fuscella]